MTPGTKNCFSSVLKADLSLPLNEGLKTYSLRNTVFSRYVDLQRSYGSLLFVVVLSDYYSRFLPDLSPVLLLCT